MAGFVGISTKKIDNTGQALKQALELTKYSNKVTIEENTANKPQFLLGRSYFDFITGKDFSSELGKYQCWIDGEIFNNEELIGSSQDSFAKKLLVAYRENSLEALLRQVDGVFIAIIYDEEKKKILMISDRYGLKPFYIYHQNGNLIFAPELKCFPCFSSFELSIRRELIDGFVHLGHFMGTATWFNHVDLIKASSIYSFDWENGALTHQYYWTWSAIKRAHDLSLDQAAEMLAEKFKKAVLSRSITQGRLGISLSGGYDSRAILAAVYKEHEVKTFTFGFAQSADVQLAARVAKKAGVSNVHFAIDGSDWLTARFGGVWKTDGLINMRHLHYSNSMHGIENLVDVNLSGFIGDLVLGGSCLSKKKKSFFNQRITEDIARHYYDQYFEVADPKDKFYDIDTVDAYVIDNRGRRVPGVGLEEPQKTIHQRIPFLEKKLMEATYSLTDDYRSDRKVYDRMLMILSPELFGDIPHVTSGVSLSEQDKFYYSGKKLFKKYLDKTKAFMGRPTSFVDYNSWISRADSVSLIQSVLNSKQALYREYTDLDFVEKYLEPHLNKNGFFSNQILAGLTIEIWLQQIVNGKYTPDKY